MERSKEKRRCIICKKELLLLPDAKGGASNFVSVLHIDEEMCETCQRKKLPPKMEEDQKKLRMAELTTRMQEQKIKEEKEAE